MTRSRTWLIVRTLRECAQALEHEAKATHARTIRRALRLALVLEREAQTRPKR